MKATIYLKTYSLKATHTLGLCIACILLTTFGVLAAPHAADATEGGNGATVLAFGDRYGSPQKQHLGCDVSGEVGLQVHSPVAGAVTFAGWVPREPSGRVRAVTVEDSDGSLVTVSPLDSTAVSRGDRVELGQLLGGVAPDGDPSSAVPHIHLSMRVEGRYVDPSHLVGLLFPTQAPNPDTDGGHSTGQPRPQLGGGTVDSRVAQDSPSRTSSTGAQNPAPTSAQQLDGAQRAERPRSLSHPLATLTAEVPIQVARAASLDTGSAVGGLLNSSAVGRVLGAQPSGSSDGAQLGLRQVEVFALALGLLGMGSAAGVALHWRIGTSKVTSVSKRFAAVFAVRGNRW